VKLTLSGTMYSIFSYIPLTLHTNQMILQIAQNRFKIQLVVQNTFVTVVLALTHIFQLTLIFEHTMSPQK
jgi:hypothetical protein